MLSGNLNDQSKSVVCLKHSPRVPVSGKQGLIDEIDLTESQGHLLLVPKQFIHFIQR